MNRVRSRIWKLSWLIAGLVLVLISLIPETLAAPSVTRQRIGIGFSLRLFRYTWGEFSCFVENPDATPHKIMVRVLNGGDNFGPQQANIFSDTFTVPAQTQMVYRSPIMVETSESYRVEVFIDGRQQGASEEVLIKMMMSRSVQSAVLDEGEFNIGAYSQYPMFKDEHFSCTMTARNFPDQWELLKAFSALIVVQPDLSRYSSRQIRALLDYVRQGGTVIFVNPEALFNLANSPWAELLPVRPLKMRKVSSLPNLANSSLLPGFKGWSEPGVDFLESEPNGDGIDLMRHEGFPLFRSKKYGLGVCRFSAIPLDERNFKERKDMERLMSFMLGTQKLCPEPDRYNACLDEMTGFPVPDASLLRSIFVSYFILLGLLLAGGLYTRRTGTAWAAAAVAALCMTAYVLNRAGGDTASKGKMVSLLDFGIYGEDSTPSESYCAFFSNSNMVLDVAGNSENSLLCGIPPNSNSFSSIPMFMNNLASDDGGGFGAAPKQGGSRFKIVKKLDIQRDVSGLARLPGLNISANTSRQFQLLDARPMKSIGGWARPRLVYGKSGPQLESWKAPEGSSFEQAFLVFPGGVRQLSVSGATLQDNLKDEAFQSDSLMRELQGCLEYGYRTPTPCVALVAKASSPPLEVPGGTKCQGRKIVFFPVREECKEEEISIDSRQVVLTPADSPTGMIMDGNRFMKNPNVSGAMTYTIKFSLPPQFSAIDPEEFVVKFNYRAQGTAIAVRPILLFQGAQKKVADDAERDSISGSAAGPEPAKAPAKAQPAKPAPAPAKAPPAKPAPKPAAPAKPKPSKPAPPPVNELPPSVIGKEVSPGVFVFSGPELKKVINPCNGTGLLMLDAQETTEITESSRLRSADKWEPVDLKISVKGRLPAGTAPFSY